MLKTALLFVVATVLTGCAAHVPNTPPAMASREQIDAVVHQMMQETGAKGLALAVIDNGQVVQVSSYGVRNASGAALTDDSIMYAASLTKTAFAYMVLQLVDEGIVDLDASIATYLPKPLPEYGGSDIERRYARWSDLADDERWKALTPRILLNHGSGFANFGFIEPDGKLRFHFQPGTRYAYSGDGIILLQFVLEAGLGLDVGKEMQRRLFEPLGMANTSLIWRTDFAERIADGWTIDGKPEPHDERSKVRAAGSMDSTIADLARLAAAMVRGDLLSVKGRQEFSRPQLPIKSASQFPSIEQSSVVVAREQLLAAGVGMVVFDGPQGRGFFKGGHNDSTGNMLTCLEARQRCVLILGNDLRAERAIPYLVDFILGDSGVPWHWEYGDARFLRPATPTP